MKTSENLQQCPAGGFFVFWDRQSAAFSGPDWPNRSRSASARDRRVGPAGFLILKNRATPTAGHARGGRQTSVP
jgi:hypothetical protein